MMEVLGLPSKVIKAWDEKPTIISKFGVILSNYKIPLKDRLTQTIYRLKIQKSRLEDLVAKIQRHDKELLNRCVNAQIAHDKHRSTMYANECAEVRKIARLTLASQLALEQVILRLETIRQFDDITSAMTSIPQVIHTIKTQMTGIMPEVSYELNDIYNTLEEMAFQAGEANTPPYLHTNTEEAQTILQEANIIAGHKIEESFPELPIQTLKVEQRTPHQLIKGAKLES